MLNPETRLKERYRIIEKIGGGGFGYVYRAIDEVFGCCVAIKETREGISSQDKLRKAFEREAKLLRSLKHVSLPRVTDYFFQDEAQFLVMDFIDGEDLATLLKSRLLNQGPFDYSEALPWGDKILAALEYLHALPEPIIHRDIKPSNIKLTHHGEVYLLDFGLAKGASGQMSTVKEGESSFSLYAFTHGYAPLEQLQDAGTRPQSDIYAMGATLYHLLTGNFPVSALTRDESLQRGQGDPLRFANEVNPAIPQAISEIISQAMIIRWWDRLASAREMRAALHRATAKSDSAKLEADLQPASPFEYIAQDQVATLPLHNQSLASSKERVATTLTQTAVQKSHPHQSLLVACLFVVFLAAVAVGVRLTFPHWFVPTTSTTSTTRTSTSENPPNLTTPIHLRPKPLLGHRGAVWSVAFSPDGTLAASGSDDTTIILWDTKTWTAKVPRLVGHEGPVYSVVFSPDGKMLASASNDKTVRIWDTQTRSFIRKSPTNYSKAVQRLSFSGDGGLLASFSGKQADGEKEIQLWDLRSNLSGRLIGHTKEVQAIAFVPGSNSLFSSGHDNNSLRLWDVAAGTKSKVLKEYPYVVRFLAVSADGKHLACGTSNTIELWSYQSGTRRWDEHQPLTGFKGEITSLAFSPDNKTLVSTTTGNTIALWNVTSPTNGPVYLSHEEISAIQWASAFSPDAQSLLTGGKDNLVWLWQ